jgi:hypothetical protein
MPNDLTQILVGLAVLILLSASFGMFSARVFMWATGNSAEGSKH